MASNGTQTAVDWTTISAIHPPHLSHKRTFLLVILPQLTVINATATSDHHLTINVNMCRIISCLHRWQMGWFGHNNMWVWISSVAVKHFKMCDKPALLFLPACLFFQCCGYDVSQAPTVRERWGFHTSLQNGSISPFEENTHKHMAQMDDVAIVWRCRINMSFESAYLTHTQAHTHMHTHTHKVRLSNTHPRHPIIVSVTRS